MLVSRSYRQLQSSLGSEVKPDNWGIREEGRRYSEITGSMLQRCNDKAQYVTSGADYNISVLTHRASSLTTTRANSWRLSILCFVRTNISIIFWHIFRAFVLDLNGETVKLRWCDNETLALGYKTLLYSSLPIERLQLWQRHLLRKV